MTTPSELVSLAVRGTTQQSPQDYQQSADTLLRLSGVRSFQVRGGFVPSIDNQALYKAHLSHSVANLQRKNLKHFQVILNEHPLMLEEWVRTSCELGKTLPDEYIPQLLERGYQHPYLQKWFKLIMSDRATWLLEQNSVAKWGWFPECKVTSFDDVITQQKKAFRSSIYKICMSLASDNLSGHHHSGLTLLKNFLPMWTEHIAGILLKVMFISNVTASYNEDSLLVEVVRKAGYRLPLKFEEEFLAELRTGIAEWHLLADELGTVFTIRREMLASLQEDS